MARRGMGGKKRGLPLANRRAANQPIDRGTSPLWDKDDEVRDPDDWRGKIGTGPHPHPRGFKKGGSVKSHGSGLARRKRR